MTQKTKNHVQFAFDRVALLNTLIGLLYIKTGDNKGNVYYQFLQQWLGDIGPHELGKACAFWCLDPDHIKTNVFGKIAHSSNHSPEDIKKAYQWMLRQPEKLALLITAQDILRAYGYRWELAERILHTAITPKPIKFTSKQQKACELILDHLRPHRIAPLDELSALIGKDCRDYLLDLRSIGHTIVITTIAESKTYTPITAVYLTKGPTDH